jgi:membrane protein implicated in regulation of membrane protease activity
LLKLLGFLCAVAGAATVWPILACMLAGGMWDVFIWRKIGFVGAATIMLALNCIGNYRIRMLSCAINA